MNMNVSRHWLRVVASVAAVGMLVPLAACGGGDSADTGDSNGPVTIEWWGWDQGQQEQADLFNKTHDDVKVNYKKQASSDKAEQALVNSVKAGNAPDLSEIDINSSISLLADGTLQDAKQLNPDLSDIEPSALESFSVGDQLAVIPYKTSPGFMIVNTKTFADAGVQIPTTWDEYIQAGKDLKAANPDYKLTNLAGEDPAGLVMAAQQFGAQWYQVKGDQWIIDINGPESKKAAKYYQEIVDNDMFSRKTFIEWDALMQYFQSGDLATIGTSTWQLSAYQANFQQSLGDWKAVPTPMESADKRVSPTNAQGNGIPTGAKHAKEAAEFAVWLATDKDALKIAANSQTGSGAFPAAKNSTDFIKDSLPDKLLDDNDEAAKVVEDSVKIEAPYRTGVNWSSMFKQLQDQWAKFLNKEVTADQMLDTVQEWTVNDLKQKGINVKSAN